MQHIIHNIIHNTQNMIYINSQIILMLKIHVTPDMINNYKINVTPDMNSFPSTDIPQ